MRTRPRRRIIVGLMLAAPMLGAVGGIVAGIPYFMWTHKARANHALDTLKDKGRLAPSDQHFEIWGELLDRELAAIEPLDLPFWLSWLPRRHHVAVIQPAAVEWHDGNQIVVIMPSGNELTLMDETAARMRIARTEADRWRWWLMAAGGVLVAMGIYEERNWRALARKSSETPGV